LIPHPRLPRHAKINRAQDHAGGIALQFDIAEFARGAGSDAVAQAHELVRAPGFGLSALSNTRLRYPRTGSDPAIIRLLRLLTIIAAGSCRQAQPPGPFGRRARPFPYTP
jgi:hypothetical protein